MKTMSAIYQKVRHRLNDDWAYGNGELVTTRVFFSHCSNKVHNLLTTRKSSH